MGRTVRGLNPGAGKILCPHRSVQWILCASQRVSSLKKLCSGVCTPPVNFTASIKKIKILWLVERKALLLSALESVVMPSASES